MASQYLERVKNNSLNDALAQAQWAEKKWSWLLSKKDGFVPVNILSENGDRLEVLLEDGSKQVVNINDTEKMNPPKYDRVEDMAELTHLNESSVVHNLRTRYSTNLIYTYSGLFCVAVNPYKKIPIYSDEVIKAYKGKKRSEMPPHVYAVVDQAYNDMVNTRENQSILITGESGAGKTENTKKVIQYLAASSNSTGKLGTLENQILQANPVLEAFGNAQTIRNNNSSRFGKFIRIEFGASGQIAGANIERYLLEKSRVTHQSPRERNYHIFYQILKGASPELKQQLLIDGGVSDYRFIKNSNKNIDGVDDVADFKAIRDSLAIMNFSESAQVDLFKVIAAILHLGNLTLEADREDQASLTAQSAATAGKVCHVLGIPVAEFSRALVKPRIKAGRDWVTQARNVEQVYYSIEALSRSLYERMFGELIDLINQTLYTPAQKASFIGVLDIAGFEIFEKNSFEQLCINYTNERLQQFFNHHMFILEQEEYKREGIEWKFIDFGLDLQPTIDLIEKTSPIGILSLLDEECVMPKASDKTFIDKLNGLWKGKSPKYDTPRFNSGFILQHYAGKVEYTVNGWLDKNKDPLNENVTRLLATSSEKFIAGLFSDSLGDDEIPSGAPRGILKKGVFRTVSQRHKESLTSLLNQLYSTQPHFVRCIIPNEEKKPGKIEVPLVLDQLRCNGVLEGIRICRAGFPNRLVFQDFRTRYEVLCAGVIPKGYIDGRKAATMLLDHLQLEKSQYRIGVSKIFFKAGVLADLENLRDIQLGKIVIRIQALMRGYLARKRFKKKIEQFRAIRIIQRNARIYVVLREYSWWKLFSKVRPLLNVTRVEEDLKRREALAKEWEEKAKREAEERAKIEALRNALDLENKKIQDLLLQEQRAAADQAEILARTQKREVDLNERLSDISKELEDRESANETLLAAKKKLEAELKALREQTVNDAAAIDRLEKDKQSKDQSLKMVETELAAEVERIRKLQADKKAVDAQYTALENRLTEADVAQNELAKGKSKLQAQLAEIESKLEQESSELAKTESKRVALELDLNSAKINISELERIKSDVDAVLKKREAEIATLNESLIQQGIEKDTIERQRRELTAKIQTVQDDLANERSEREKLAKLKKKVEEEVEELHKIMEAKGNQSTKQTEFLKLREQELSSLKSQLASSQAELEETRKKGYATTEALNSEIAMAKQENAGVTKAKQFLESQISELRDSADKSEEERVRLERGKRQAEGEIDALKQKIAEMDSLLFEIRSQKELVEKQLATITSQSEQYQAENIKLDREKQGIQRFADSLKDELEQEVQKKQSLESQKKKLSVEISDLQARLEEEINSKNDTLAKLSQKSTELDSIKEKYNRDVITRTAELEESKKKVEKDLIDSTAKLEEVARNASNLERTRARLSTEIEDLKLEIEREHNTTRNAERLLKQVEAQLNQSSIDIEDERRHREVAESSVRKLQSSVDALQASMDEKNNQIASLQKNKTDLDAELKNLINEIGDGGKNLHELEKTKRRLESRIDELQLLLETEESNRKQSEESKKTIDAQFSEFRKKYESDIQAKDTQTDELRRMLMKEVNSLGDQLDDTTNAKNEALKAKKKLEEQVIDLTSIVENSARGQSDFAKTKAKNEAQLRDLQQRLEEEHQLRENYQELCSRHEKKVNTLQTELEKVELQLDGVERSKKQLQQQVEELDQELNTGDDSKQNLLESRRRLNTEISTLKKKLEESEEEREVLLQQKSAVPQETGLRGAALLEYEDKISKLEESRRALLAAQRISNQEIDEKTSLLASSDKARRQLQQDLDDVKARLEAETVAKQDESGNRRKLASEVRDLQMRIESEVSKSSGLAEALQLYKVRADQITENLEAAELGRLRAEKNESQLLIQLNEMQESLDAALKGKQSAEDQVKGLEERITDLQDKVEDHSHELAEVFVAKKKLQDEIFMLADRHKSDLEEREAFEDQTRKKYQKEIRSLLTDLENEKTTSISLKESVRDLETEIESLNIKIDAELRSSILWKKEREKFEQRLEDSLRHQSDLASKAEEQQQELSVLNSTVRELRSSNEDKAAQLDQLEKIKATLEEKLIESESQLSHHLKDMRSMGTSKSHLDQQTQELKESLDEALRECKQNEERVKRSEMHAQEIQAELTRERSVNIEMEKAKMVLEKNLKELNSRVFELESINLARDTNTARRLESRVEELTLSLENEIKLKNEAIKETRRLERQAREVVFYKEEVAKIKAKADEETEKMEQKFRKLKTQLDELELSENNLQLAKRKAEREAAEYKERSLKYEKEIDTLRRRGSGVAA